MTKLSRYSDGLLEATWLAAVLVIPIYFNVFSSRIFEPDKIVLLRTIALLTLAAWSVKLIENGGINWELWQRGDGWLRTIIRIPLILPVAALGVAYIIATIFSITPAASLWGSYQRLQGTYTTFSYLVIFFSLICNLRRRDQIDRLITVIIVASVPTALYGLLQRYKLDPIPWGGDVSRRIASTMGNSIFIAAYLIMVFPITLGRVIESFRAIVKDEKFSLRNTIRGTIYVFIASIQVIALYMSGSRGPALGWMAGLFFIILMLGVYWRKRWLTIAFSSMALLVALFLLVFNLEGGPLETFRTSPAIGRFGLLLNAESNSALVRRYIWEGVVDMVSPHAPLEFPDGSKDPFNTIRPIIGYGPESMYVAYSPFYVPALGLVERRNATPDRSHNETWDSIVITGLLGLAAYYSLFISIFYFGFKWMGLLGTIKRKQLFLGLIAAGGLAGGILFSTWRGLEYLGVGLPFGIFTGLIAYVVIISIFGTLEQTQSDEPQFARFVLLLVLTAAIISHFVEINFGISVAVTRIYFWVFTGLLLLVGYVLPKKGFYNPEIGAIPNPSLESVAKFSTRQKTIQHPPNRIEKKKSRLAGSSRPHSGQASAEIAWDWRKNGIIGGIIVGMILATLGFDLISNPTGANNGLQMILRSMTVLTNTSTSFGVLMLFVIAWILAAFLMSSESIMMHKRDANERIRDNDRSIWKIFALVLIVSFVISFVYWLWHAAHLVAIAQVNARTIDQLLNQISQYEQIVSKYFIYFFLLVMILGSLLPEGGFSGRKMMTWRGATAGVVSMALVFLLALTTNLRVSQADIVFKLAEPFNKQGQWPVAISIYHRANDLAPNEDYYYLFLGRAYLEYARSLSDPAEQESIFLEAETELEKAQHLSPLNSDHTANLARLHSLWASFSKDPQQKAEHAAKSEEYFSKAVLLSPKNVRIWDERALLALQLLNQPKIAREYLDRALEIDQSFDLTYAILADYYQRQAAKASTTEENRATLQKAEDAYRAAIVRVPDNQTKFNYTIGLAGIYEQLGQFADAIDTYKESLAIIPPGVARWLIERQIAQMFYKEGMLDDARYYAEQALANAPEDQKEAIKVFIDQLSAEP